MLRFEPGDPVWLSVPKFGDEVRGHVVRYDGNRIIVKTCANGVNCTVKSSLVTYRYEKEER